MIRYTIEVESEKDTEPDVEDIVSQIKNDVYTITKVVKYEDGVEALSITFNKDRDKVIIRETAFEDGRKFIVEWEEEVKIDDFHVLRNFNGTLQ